MLHALRTLLMTLALVGFLGQSTAHATPLQVFAAHEAAQSMPMDCAEMPGMTNLAKTPAPAVPCKGMTADCVGKMGCATVASPLPSTLVVTDHVAYERLTFANADQAREGVNPPPPYVPPIRRA